MDSQQGYTSTPTSRRSAQHQHHQSTSRPSSQQSANNSGAAGPALVATMGGGGSGSHPRHGPPHPPPYRARTSSVASSMTNATSIDPAAGLQGQQHRPLPDRDILAGTAEEAYVEFIFACNPFLPPSTAMDTTELRRGFNALPKTDGKTFAPFPLFELIRKLENKEIETWAQLVIEMGVKQPDVASGQSTQKVQQYAVRLKRWLHAYHIDAFFQYCLGKTNSYFTDIPQITEISETTIRDGVPPEEDLAIRALLPEWRPKRGRRPHDDPVRGSPNAKRQMRATSLTADEHHFHHQHGHHPASAIPLSAHPQSAYPWDRHSNSSDAWQAPQRTIAPRGSSLSHRTPASPDHPAPSIETQLSFYQLEPVEQAMYPQSAVHTRPPSSAFPASAAGPHSAHPFATGTASPSPRPRKRHGPHVSAAWTPDSGSGSGSGGSGGKVRGRPPANRSTQDGPFGTFPAKAPSLPPPSGQHPAPPTPQSSQQQAAPNSALQQPTPSTAHTATTAESPFGALPPPLRRPSKLQLQVPQHAGGPVRLATPPRVLLNGALEGAAAAAVAHRMERRTSADFYSSLGGDDGSELGTDEVEVHGSQVDWKRRATLLQRRVRELEAELKAVKRRVLEAVM